MVMNCPTLTLTSLEQIHDKCLPFSLSEPGKMNCSAHSVWVSHLAPGSHCFKANQEL